MKRIRLLKDCEHGKAGDVFKIESEAAVQLVRAGTAEYCSSLDKTRPEAAIAITKKLGLQPDALDGLVATERPAEIPEILKNPELMKTINQQLDLFIVGEDDTRQTIFLIVQGGKLVENAEPTSSNLMVNDASGAGKDHITRSVLKLLPEQDVIARKRISEKAFTYWGNEKFNPEWNWDGKVFYNEDLSNSILNADVFKVMSSSDGVNKSTILINQVPIDIVVKGKPVMIITTATASPKQELLRRFSICSLNVTEDQTKLILKRKAEFHKTGRRPVYNEEIKKALSFLKRVKVKVTFADKLVEVLSTKNIIIRTHFDRLIDYIKFSAAIHQYQREKDEAGYLVATPEDYEQARQAVIKTTSNVFSVPLTKNQQLIMELLQKKPEGVGYSVTDLEPEVTFISDRMLRTELDRLSTFGFLQKDKEAKENSTKPVMVYRYLQFNKITIPTWQDIQNISNASTDTNSSNDSNDSNTKRKKGAIEAFEANERHTQPEKPEIRLQKLIKKHPTDNVELIRSELGEAFVDKFLSSGRLFESPAGTYLLEEGLK